MTLNNPVSEKVEVLTYAPDLKNSGDLEAATKTITATVEATGTGNADYSAALTLGAPSDARLVVIRISTRLSVSIDSLSTGANLLCRVYVDSQVANNLLYDLTFTTSGATQLNVQDVNASTKATIFNLLKDGAAHTFYFFFWKSAAGTGDTVLSLVNLWEGVGSSATGTSVQALRLDHSGLVTLGFQAVRTGTGNLTGGWEISDDINTSSNRLPDVTGSNTGRVDEQVLVKTSAFWCTKSTVATDLVYLYNLLAHLRSQT